MSTRDLLLRPLGGDLRAAALRTSASLLADAALFVDADGTLLDIAPSPDQATAPPGLADTLAAISAALDGALAIVSGRRIVDLDRIFAPVRFAASGVHGAEIRNTPDAAVTVRHTSGISSELARDVRRLGVRFPKTIVEDKGEAIAVHWRACPLVEADVYDAIARLLHVHDARHLVVMRGHFVFEIKSSGTTKGEAVRAFMLTAPFAGRRPIFIGDDVTDVAGLHAAKALGGSAFSVSAPLPGADAFFDSPAEVRAWLESLVPDGGRDLR
jgi:trehalose 6-phosphate phosphatase